MTVKYEVFKGTFTSFKKLFEKAADFATSIGKERIINITHSWDHTHKVVTVWFWEE